MISSYSQESYKIIKSKMGFSVPFKQKLLADIVNWRFKADLKGQTLRSRSHILL